ncbi:SCO1664 family protein [Georgenia sp. Z1491]|uniref:SCO1664 family protein n=1 Tax=Georgenia sp. Z1491 TaxID=3416707 RepID=UPI003CF8DD91
MDAERAVGGPAGEHARAGEEAQGGAPRTADLTGSPGAAAATDPCGATDPSGTTDLLLHGDITVIGRLADSSNETFLVEVSGEGDLTWAIYKPELGEAPLRDFPPGLYRRERAAYLLSESLGWHLVPTTVLREEVPFGVGSLQRFVEHDRSAHYFTLVDDAPETHDDLRRIAVFDVLTNNTDRKSGHVLRGEDGRVWGIDHGLCFSARPKLRTVIWDFADERIDADLLAAVAPVVTEVDDEIAALLDDDEVDALRRRALRLVTEGRLPVDLTGMAFPWPLV